MSWELVVGMEVHAQLATRTKLFCGCAAAFGGAPNSRVCPVCLALPGSLPVLNRAALTMGLRLCLALGCTVPEATAFDRKSYFYPDLPKNFQISQEHACLGTDGRLRIELEGRTKEVAIANVHLEEDAGKLAHPEGGGTTSDVDLNRAGTPLAEIVSAPELYSVAEADAFMRALRELLVGLGVCDGKMQEGSLRFEASVSVRREGQGLGPRVEIKNLNSMRAVRQAIAFEHARQRAVLDGGASLVQETRLWDGEDARPWAEDVPEETVRALLPDGARGKTLRMRGKEDAADYRYFPEPDLPVYPIARDWLEQLRNSQPELPAARRARLREEHGLPAHDARQLAADPTLCAYFEEAAALAPAREVAHWLLNDLASLCKERDLPLAACPVRPSALAALLGLLEAGRITRAIARQNVLPRMFEGADPERVVAEEGLAVVDDEDALAAAIAALLDARPDIASAFHEGRTQVVGFVIGQVLRGVGQADARLVRRLALEALEARG